MHTLVRDETPADAEAIHAVTTDAFLNAPHTAHTEQFIVRALRTAGALSISLVAEEHGAVVGHVALSPVQIEDGSEGWYGLGPISVTPGRQRAGVGSLLMRAAIERLKTMGASGCLLVGDPAFYARFGFRAEPGVVFPGVPPEYFQALLLKGALPRGVATFHDAFTARA